MAKEKNVNKGFQTSFYVQPEDIKEFQELLKYKKENRRTLSYLIMMLWKFYKKNGGLKK